MVRNFATIIKDFFLSYLKNFVLHFSCIFIKGGDFLGNSSSWRNSESAFRFCPCDALTTTSTRSVWLKLEKLLETKRDTAGFSCT